MAMEELIRGATWFLERAIEELSKSRNPLEDVERIRSKRPGMAPLEILWLLIKENEKNILKILNNLKKYIIESKEKLNNNINNFDICPNYVATISFSRAVVEFIRSKSRCIKRLYLMESKPGVEFNAALAEYSRHVRVIPLPDSAIGAFEYDYVVIGLDGFFRDYAVNKVGTLPLLLTAKERGAETIAVFESYKICPCNAPEPYKLSLEYNGIRVEIPLFDLFKHKLLNYLITDFGISKDIDIDKIWGYLKRYVYED